jgi:hypothetical protein
MNWADYFKQLTLSLIAIPIVTAGGIYFAKLIFDRWFKAREQDYQHRLRIAQDDHKHSLELIRESHIETLRQLNKKDEIRFSGLNQLQLKGIEKLYDELLALH